LFSLSNFCAEANPKWIYFDSVKGIQYFEESRYKLDFFKLAPHFELQRNEIFCGVATSTIVLNALYSKDTSVKKPIDETQLSMTDRTYLPKDSSPIVPRFTQNSIFVKGAKSKLEVLGKPIPIKGKQKKDFGFQIRQLATLYKKHGAKVELIIFSKRIKLNAFRSQLKRNLLNPKDFVVVNFNYKELGRDSGGHISPIAAFHEKSDSVLILDVNPNIHGWYWVRLEDLFKAMNTFDTVENRGYLLVSK
jgi:hypothetical protein